LNSDIGVPDIVSDIDTDIGNVMPDIEVSNHDIGAPPISVLKSEAWCSDIGVYYCDPISDLPISGHKTTISEFFPDIGSSDIG